MEKLKAAGVWFMGLQDGKSSWLQDMTRKEKGLILMKSLCLWLVTVLLFYSTALALLPALPVAVLYARKEYFELAGKKEEEFRMQFKEAILTLSSQLAVGYSVENAWKETGKDLGLIYGEEARIIKEIQLMLRQLRLQMSMEQVMNEFAQRVKLDDVQSFVTVFTSAKKNGGDMLRIIQDTVRQIGDKIEVRREISTILAAKKYEFRVMSMIPFGIIAYMRLSFPEFMQVLYGNLIGTGVMTLCLLAYLGAYIMGIKMINIEL